MAGYLDRYVAEARKRGRLVVQPRMGFARPERMGDGLRAVASLGVPAVGTITVDSYTRVGDHHTPLERIADGEELNGYPIVSHPAEVTRSLLSGVYGPAFPVQVRHGTALPQQLFRRLVEVGIDATEGGPVSYCLPYSRIPLADAVDAWAEGCRILAGETAHAHIESFGGCLLGQLCPPSLPIAIAVLEAMFFRQHGIRQVSLSYAQGTLEAQDRGALRALRELAAHYLTDVDWHVVLYTYMGVFPTTPYGAAALIADSARLARATACERIIVKTVSEARQIPTVDENLAALTLAAVSAAEPDDSWHDDTPFYEEIRTEAALLIEHTVSLSDDLGRAFVRAFDSGALDVPYCLHPDNPGATSGVIDDRGALVWNARGRLPLPGPDPATRRRVGSADLLRMLHHVAGRYDALNPATDPRHQRSVTRAGDQP